MLDPVTAMNISPINPTPASPRDRFLAGICLACPVCQRARRTQGGLAFRMVRAVEARVCPFCRAYTRVYGRRPHEPFPPAPALRQPK